MCCLLVVEKQQSIQEPLKKSSGLMGNNNLEAWSFRGQQQRSLSPQNYSPSRLRRKDPLPKEYPKASPQRKINFLAQNAIQSILARSCFRF